jgi:hypothetical protein
MLATSEPEIVNYDPHVHDDVVVFCTGPLPAFVISATRLNGADDKPRPVASTGGPGRLRDPRLA